MRHRQKHADGVVPERELAFLGLAVGGVKDRECQRILKYRRRPVEKK